MNEQNERLELSATLSRAQAAGGELTVQRARLRSLSKKEIVGTAAELGWVYHREEIEGDEWRLIFRRGPGTVAPDTRERAVPDWRTQLQQAEPDLRGMVEVDLSGFGRRLTREDQAQIVQIAASYGWDSHGFTVKDRKPYWRFARREATPVKGFDDQFVNGPSLSELRRSEAAKQEADRVRRDTGIDVLSDAALNEMRSAHVRLRRRTIRWAWPSALSAIMLIFLLYASFDMSRDDDATNDDTATVLGVMAAIAVVGFVVPMIVAIRFNRKRRAATRSYLDGYKRVAQAALYPRERG